MGILWICAYTLTCLTVASALASEEQALLKFAAQLSNFETASANWTGWGKDNNTVCPSTQIAATSEYMCEASYPLALNPNNQSWTGVICSQTGTVLCLSLAEWGLAGDISALGQLATLADVQQINLSNNSLSGQIPPYLPANISAANKNAISLTALYLSNNSLTGTLPALWGNNLAGFGGAFQRLYVNGNQLTGSLPALWSDSRSLLGLTKVDVSYNDMSGAITWTDAKMPSLKNLIVLPGNHFCGAVSSSFARSTEGLMADGQQIQVNISNFDNTCPGMKDGLSRGAISGIVLAAVGGVLLALVIWGCIWLCVKRRRRQAAAVNEKATPAKAVTDSNVTSNLSTAVMLAHLSNVHTSDFEPKTASFVKQSTGSAGTPTIVADTIASPEGTVFVTSRNMTGASEDWQWPLPESQVIPAPLWQEVEILPENLRIAHTSSGSDFVLGQGSYGTVYKGIKDNVHEVAIKVFHAITSPRDIESLQREIAVLRSCNNKNIVHFYGVCFKGLDAWLVMELLEKGNLYNALAYGKGLCQWYQRGANIALDIAKGLHFLHNHHVMHLDLKSPNILLAVDGTAKIADVGLARIFTAHSVPVTKNTGTFHWMAPELIAAGRCTEKADIFSFGVVLYEILTAQQPIRGRSQPLQVPEQCPQAIADLVQRCQAELPESRPNTAEIIQVISANMPLKQKRPSSSAKKVQSNAAAP